MDYEIITTLGPSSADEIIWRGLLEAGATGFRLNTSHLTLEALEDWLTRLAAFLPSAGRKFPVVLDLQGSKWRLGSFKPFYLETGSLIELTCAHSTDKPSRLPVPHPDFFVAGQASNGEIVLNDAKVRLTLEKVNPDSLLARVVQGGEILPRQGITYMLSSFRHESLNEKDEAILAATSSLDFVRYAVSYIKDAVEMAAYRSRIGPAYLIAKLEREAAMDDSIQIAAHADELWVCRGDLGAELGLSRMAQAVAQISEIVPDLPAPVFMAGQVLEHMVHFPDPTRSEVCYLYDSIHKGYQGYVLSNETAVGQFPLESCRAAAMFKG